LNVLYLLSLDRTANLVFWAAVVQVGAFYMQRLHFETLTEWGTESRGPKLLSLAARAMGWLAFATAAYIVLRVGVIPAIVGLLVMFAAPLAVSTLDVWLLRSPARPMAIVCTPLTVLALAMMLRAARQL
jgi:hypothetical protein